MRFQLHHLLATLTTYAILLSLLSISGHLERDGIWEVRSIDRSSTNIEGIGPLYEYTCYVQDGDRKMQIPVGNSWNTRPRPGDLLVLSQHEPNGSTIWELYSGEIIALEQAKSEARVIALVAIGFVAVGIVVISVLLHKLILRWMHR